MARNIEVKARSIDPQRLLTRVLALKPHHHEVIQQDDTFFHCSSGRLKLRDFGTGQGELIYYERPVQAGPKTSFYVRTPTQDPEGLREALTLAHGQLGRIHKSRALYLVGRTRIHVDDVEGLGHFVELEVVLNDEGTLPTLFERCLGITADFEGHGFGLLQGNFDGAGLTWGVIGFTLSNGEIQQILADAEAIAPGTMDRTMGPLAQTWRARTALPRAEQLAWADSISSGPSKTAVPPEWKQAFARLGEEPVVQRLQMHRAYEAYFLPAAATAKKLGLISELGVALSFDCHVQNGSSRKKAAAELASLAGTISEAEMRKRFANRVADLSAPPWREDVRGRKLTIATGHATFRGRAYQLANWGLGEATAA